jgi:sulfopyruvate decarboxylase TPP-binding subunit
MSDSKLTPRCIVNTTIFRGNHDQEVTIQVPIGRTDTIDEIMDKVQHTKHLAGGEDKLSLTDEIIIRFEPRIEPVKVVELT